RTVGADQLFEIGAVQELHCVIEDALSRAAVVEDCHGARVAEPRRQLNLALESVNVVRTRPFRRQQLDGRRPTKQRVPGAIDDAHTTLADLLLARVLPQVGDLAAVGSPLRYC